MPAYHALLKFVAKAALNHVGFGVAGDVAVDVLPAVAKDVWQWWCKDRTPQQAREEIEAIAKLPASAVRQEAIEIVEAESSGADLAKKLKLIAYIEQIPKAIRQSQRRPSDPSGRSVSPALSLQKPEDILALLPHNLPRFKAGDPLPGSGDWELVELLGMGGFGEVWKARNPHMADPVAIKFCLDREAAKVLRNEAKMLGRVCGQKQQPSIVRLLDTNLSAEPPYLKYEYVSGGDLTGLIYQQLEKHRGKMPPEQVRRIIRHLARALSHPHQLDPPIVHRDMKPANVLVQQRADGTVSLHVADFGIGGVAARQAIDRARDEKMQATGATVVRGSYTPNYASPQQMKGDDPDPRDDVHALGVMWYQMLVGDLNEPAPPGIGWRKQLAERGMQSAELDLIQSCFEYHPDHRPRDAKDLVERMESLAQASVSLTLSGSLHHPSYGQAVTLTAATSASRPGCVPTGNATFLKAGGSVLGIATLDPAGRASLTTSSLPVGSHTLIARYGGDAQCAAGESATLTQKVDSAPLTVAAGDASKVSGQANPPFAVTFSGFVNSESESVLRGALRFMTDSTTDSAAGAYPVLPTGLTSDNYRITYLPGTLTVSPREDFRQDVNDAVEEWRTKGNSFPYFERHGAARLAAWTDGAQRGDAHAQWLLARCLQEGIGIEKSSHAALAWLRKAAESGLAVAQNEFGDCYYEGEVVEEDLAEAVRWV